MNLYKIVKKVRFQMFYPVEGDGTVMEFLDDGSVIMDISVNEDDTHQFVVYRSEKHISIPLSEILRGIEIAKREVINVRYEKDSS